MMTNHIINTLLTYQIDLPSLWNFPACWSSLCEEIVEDLDMACGHGNLLTLGCCTSWSKVGQATCQNTDVSVVCINNHWLWDDVTSGKHDFHPGRHKLG